LEKKMQIVTAGKVKFAIAVAMACMALAGSAKADPFTGGFGFLPALVNSDGTASFDSSSLTMNGLDAVSYDNGSFAGELLATLPVSTTTITGLSAAPTAVNVPDFITFASPSQLGPTYGQGNGNEYEFNLLTLSETTPGGFGNFLGTGLLVDNANVLDPTPAIITIGFTGTGNNYTGTITPTSVPEPATMGLVAAGLLGALARRHRKA
jgi:hypothetical protein